jgi:N-acyl homoserine lactone hydrolase
MDDVSVRRLDFGYFVRPAAETGTGQPRVEPCLGYAIRHPRGVLLFDTGMGSAPDVDQHYRPRRRPLATALRDAGVGLDDVAYVSNCHLHFDHCGGNPQLSGRPVFVQSRELDEARNATDYTLPELLDGSSFEPFDDEAEVLPGLWLIPTPGHTQGHQSLVVVRPDGSLVVAGQSHDTSSAYSADVLAWRARRDRHTERLPAAPEWIDRLQQFDPRSVYFAHDHAVWTP